MGYGGDTLLGEVHQKTLLEMTTFVICFCSFTSSYGVLNLFSYEMSFFGVAPIDNCNRVPAIRGLPEDGGGRGGYCHRTKIHPFPRPPSQHGNQH